MRIFITTTILLLYFLTGCNNSQKEDNTNVNTALFDSLMIEKIEKGIIANIEWKKEQWYDVRFKSLCDDSKGIFLDFKKVSKYGKHNPFDTIQQKFKDSTVVSFTFISDCCLEYSGEVIIRNDTLFLGYGHTTDIIQPCDCYCDYKMTYRISTKDKHWKKTIIKQGRLK